MAIDNELVEQIKQKANIVDIVSEYVQLTRKGQNHWGVCPFHKDTKPSMAVTANKQIFKCFVCGESGNVFSFVQKYNKITFPEAVKLVGKKVGIDVQVTANQNEKPIDPEVKALIEVNEQAMNFYAYQLSEDPPSEVKEYLVQRSLDEKVCARFAIGYAPRQGNALSDFLSAKGYELSIQFKAGLISEANGRFHDAFKDRLMFPIKNENGAVVAFSGRLIGDKSGPKYVNSPATKAFVKGNILYNYHLLKEQRNLDNVFVLEGFMDVIALHKAGIDNAIATMGTAFTKEHIALFKRVCQKLTLCFDSDNAGQAAALKAGEQLFNQNFEVQVVTKLPDEAKDVDELLKKHGSEAVQKALSNTVPFVAFKYEYVLQQAGNGPDAKLKAVRQIAAELAQMADRTRAVVHAEWVEQNKGLSPGTITDLLKKEPERSFQPIEPSEPSTPRVAKSRKARHQLAEDQLLLLMLVHPEQTIPIYREKLGYMNSMVHQEIADAVAFTVQGQKQVDPQQIKEQVSLTAGMLIDEILAPSDPVLDAIDRQFSASKVADYIKIIAGARLESAIARLVEQNKDPTTSEKTKTDNLKRIVELKKKKEQISDKQAS